MTIKQQGGIFGRNPTFNDVETNDLTVTGTFAVSGGGSFEGDTLYIDAPNDRVGINTSSPQTALQVNTGAAGFGTFLHSSGAGGLRVTGAAGASGANILLANDFNGGGDDRWAFSLNGGNDALSIASGGIASALGGSGTERITVDTSGNMSLKTGNLVIGTSGKGIDFSATSGTGTSELFSDYEEGNWTPAFSEVTVTHTSQSGTYTKIGRMVYVTAAIEVSSIDNTDTSGVEISGLPFAASGTIALNWTKNYAGNPLANATFDTSPVTAAPANSTFIQLRRVNTAASSNTGSRYVDLFNASGQIQFTAWYYTA